MQISKTQRKEISRFAKDVCRKHGKPDRKTDLYREIKRLYEQGRATKDNVARAIMKHLPVRMFVEKEKK